MGKKNVGSMSISFNIQMYTTFNSQLMHFVCLHVKLDQCSNRVTITFLVIKFVVILFLVI